MEAGREIELIGAAWGIGGADAGCAQAPAELLGAGLEALLRERGARVRLGATVSQRHGERAPQQAVRRLSTELASHVSAALATGRFPCVLGGDHSSAIGVWSGAARALAGRGRIGLLWIDAHMDSHVPSTSPSGRIHGMPLALLLGQGDHQLHGLDTGALDPEHVCLIGVRSFEREEAQLLARLGVRVFHMDEIRERGLNTVFAQAIELATRGTAGYGITLDLDVIDPREMPGVATPAAGGLTARELLDALAGVSSDRRLLAFELVEYTPRGDAERRGARLAMELTSAVITGRYEAAGAETAARGVARGV